MKAFHKRLLTGLLVLGMSASAMANDMTMCDQMGAGQRGRGQGMMADGSGATKHAERMKARIDRRQAVLHNKLKLNAEQEVAWTAFIAGAKPPAMGMKMDRAEIMKLSAPERMEKMISFMKDREARMTVRLVELKKFYAVLTPQQQKIFDAESVPQHGRMHTRGKM